MNDTWWVGDEQLDDDQKEVVALPLNENHLILGPPGSGKTNLLLLRASYTTSAGQANILVIVFTRTLQEFIAAGSQHYPFPASKVKTCRRWQREFLREYGIDVTLQGSFEEQRDFLLKKLSKLVQKNKLANVYDAILLDEAHDYLPEEIELFGKLGRVVFATADSRQKIYSGEDSMDALTSLLGPPTTLRYHYRIGHRICELADALGKDSSDYVSLKPTSNYNEDDKPSSVDWLACATVDEQADKIITGLTTQLKAYPDELLGVICPRAEEVRQIWQRIAESPLGASAVVQGAGGTVSFTPETKICVCTLHAAKGLEFRGLHIGGAEFINKFKHQRNMAYTGVTRAKTSLSIYHVDQLPGYFEQALNSLHPGPKLPNLRDLFKRKK